VRVYINKSCHLGIRARVIYIYNPAHKVLALRVTSDLHGGNLASGTTLKSSMVSGSVSGAKAITKWTQNGSKS
jgi:hypothetical protein